MQTKKRTTARGGGALSQTIQNLPHQPQICFEGESLARFLKSVQREIKSARALDETLPLKFWIKQQFAVGINEVTRGLERMPPSREQFGTNVDDSESRCGYFQVQCRTFIVLIKYLPSEGRGDCIDLVGYASSHALKEAILLASDCNPRSLTKHLPALAASRNVPLIFVRDKKEGSLRLGELIRVKTAIAIGVKAKGNAINQLLEEALTDNKIDNIEDES